MDPKHRSRALTEGPARAAARAYLHGIGFDAESLSKPIVGVAHCWIETMPCNFTHRALAQKVKEVRQAGGTPMELNTIAISDGVTMGTSGMKTSLVSREVIADSIELVARGHLFDALVCISGCDKTIPATVMALARLDVPGLMLYSGSIHPGRFHDEDVTIQEVFEAVGKHASGQMSDEELAELERVASPGAGACGGQFTANTMAMAFEVLGISPMGSSMVPAEDGRKAEVAIEAGRLAVDVLDRGLRPSDVITKKSLENAIAAVATSGGSTNAVLHLLAIARESGVELEIDDFDRIAERTPLTCDLKPGGRYVATDLYAAGGVPLVAKRLQEGGLLHDDAITVTGRTVGEHAHEAQETAGQQVVRPLDDPIKPTGGLAILRGNLAPEGCVVKLSGHERRHHSGHARVFESRRRRWPRSSKARSAKATSSSSATRAPRAAPGCARCSPSPRRSTAPGSASTSRCSPTGASAAPPTASWRATWPRRPSTAGRSPPFATATRSRSTSTPAASTSRSPTTRSSSARPPAPPPNPDATGVLAKYAALVTSASRGRGHEPGGPAAHAAAAAPACRNRPSARRRARRRARARSARAGPRRRPARPGTRAGRR